MAPRSPARTHPCSRCARAQAGPVQEKEAKGRRGAPPSSPHTTHPAAEEQTQPGGDGSVDRGSQQPGVENQPMIGMKPLAQAIGAFSPRIVLEINGAEE